MHSFDLILTLTGGLAAALVLGYLTQRLRLSPIVGYLIAGLLVGPYTPGFVADRALAEQLAEIGVILLMFGVGLQFHIEELLAVRKVAIPGAVVQSVVATGLGVLVASSPDGVFRLDWSLASRSPWRAPSSWSGCLRTTVSCTRRRGTSRSVGWWWKTCSRCWYSC
jgi:predicted Kef-type K+ transport protein